MSEEWPVWRLVLENVATLDALESAWCLDDVMRANALLDMRADIEESLRPRP